MGEVPVDLIEAAKWIDLAQRKSHHGASRMLQAMIDIHGWEVVGEGKRRGFQWQQELYNSEAGWPAEAPEEIMACVDADSPKGANYGFGSLLNDGKELPFDYEKSFRFFLRGAEQDDCINCTYNVGHAYYCGKGVRADPYQAVNWLKRALNMGDAKAALWLGVMAQRGHGLPQDRSEALYFCRQAQRLGHPDAGRMIDAIDQGAEFL